MITAIFLLVLGLAGWTMSTLMSKGKLQDEITKELGNIFESLKKISKIFKTYLKKWFENSGFR